MFFVLDRLQVTPITEMIMLLPSTRLNTQSMGMQPKTCYVMLCFPAQIEMQISRKIKRWTINSHRLKRQSYPIMIFCSLVHVICIAGWVACLQTPLNLFLTSTTNSDSGIVCSVLTQC